MSSRPLSLPLSLFRVAAVALRSSRGEAAQNAARVAAWLARAAREGIPLVVFPELCLAGYASLAKLSREVLEALAEPLDGPSLRAVSEAVERTGVAAGVGLIERAADGRLFNSYVICMPGGLRHCHRKLHAFEHRRVACGERFTVFDTAWGVRVGVLIGADNYLVENVRMTALMGATLLVAPHRRYGGGAASGWEMQPVSAQQMLRSGTRASHPVVTNGAGGALADGVAAERRRGWLTARARDNGIFVVFSDGVELAPHQGAAGTGMMVDPCGRVLIESTLKGDDMISTGLDPAWVETSPGRQWLDARRPDLYAPLGQSAQQMPAFEAAKVPARGSIALSFAQVSRGRVGR